MATFFSAFLIAAGLLVGFTVTLLLLDLIISLLVRVRGA